MDKIRYTSDSIVTPECCFVEKWGINLSCKDPDAVSITYHNNVLYCGFNTVHDVKHRDFESEPDYLDCRLWLSSKIISVWALKDVQDISFILKCIQDKLSSCDYISNPEDDNRPLDISDYNIIFLTENDHDIFIARCCLEELYFLSKDINILNNEYERQFHILTPQQKERFRKAGVLNLEKYYREGIKKWKNKIGDIDVAEYHILTYEE